jgi:broad specificity phosphatase PhoE
LPKNTCPVYDGTALTGSRWPEPYSNNAASHITTIVLTRHGHVDGILPKRFRGREDLMLTKRGEAEVRVVAEYIAAQWRPTKVYTSPLRRCVATGAAIASACHVEAAVLDELDDLDYGSWQFKTYEEIEHTHPQLFAEWFAAPHLVRFPGGESLQDLVARTADALRFVSKHHVDDTVVLVGHDSVNRALLMQMLDQPLSSYWRLAQDPCCINEIDVVGWSIRVQRINETRHLREIEGGCANS